VPRDFGKGLMADLNSDFEILLLPLESMCLTSVVNSSLVYLILNRASSYKEWKALNEARGAEDWLADIAKFGEGNVTIRIGIYFTEGFGQ